RRVLFRSDHQAIWIGCVIPGDHPLEAGPPVVGTRPQCCKVGGVNRPQQAADGGAKRTSTWFDRLIRGEPNEFGYTELSAEESQERGFQSNGGARVREGYVLARTQQGAQRVACDLGDASVTEH